MTNNMKRKAPRKRSPKSAAMMFTTKKALSLDTTGPSGKTYSFKNGEKTPVKDKLDIASFMSNPQLMVFGSGGSDHADILGSRGQKSPKPQKIKGLMSEDQLDHMYNTARNI